MNDLAPEAPVTARTSLDVPPHLEPFWPHEETEQELWYVAKRASADPPTPIADARHAYRLRVAAQRALDSENADALDASMRRLRTCPICQEETLDVDVQFSPVIPSSAPSVLATNMATPVLLDGPRAPVMPPIPRVASGQSFRGPDGRTTLACPPCRTVLTIAVAEQLGLQLTATGRSRWECARDFAQGAQDGTA